MYFKRLQADFDSRVVKQGSKKYAKTKLSALATDFSNYIGNVFAPSYAPAQALA